jgi:TrmH family RNA methyltransferase
MLTNARVVLVQPHYAGNVGSVARVMCNFGLKQLTLVEPFADYNSPESRRLARYGMALLDTAIVVNTLEEAVADCGVVLATSGNVGGLYRQHNYGRPDELFPSFVQALSAAPCALVFGPEPTGLSTEDVMRCHGIIRILTDSTYSSLNLAQAVSICLYELRRTWLTSQEVATKPTQRIAAYEDQERMFANLRDALEKVHFVWGNKGDSLMYALRHLITRAQPSPNEIRILHGLARQLRWFAEHGVPYDGGPTQPPEEPNEPSDDECSRLVMVCWTCAIVVLGWTWIPAIISGLGGARYSLQVEETSAFTVDPNDLGFMDWYVMIRNLGYEPHGKGRLRITFAAAKWRDDRQLAIFHSRKDKAFLILQKSASSNVWTPIIFATCWTNGGLLLTNSALNVEAEDDGDYDTQGIETNDIHAVSDLHAQQVQKMIRKGFRVESDSSLSVLKAAMEKHTAPMARYQFVKQGQLFITLRLMIHAMISIPIVWILGWLHVGLPLVNLAMGLLLSYSDYMMEQKIARDTEEKYPRANES